MTVAQALVMLVWILWLMSGSVPVVLVGLSVLGLWLLVSSL